MIYQIVFPIHTTVSADSYNNAIKNFIKLNHDLKIDRIIIKDHMNYYNANINYYLNNGHHKLGINMFPLPYNFSVPPLPNIDSSLIKIPYSIRIPLV